MAPYDIDEEIRRLGQRAEILANWYLRFNGYFPLQDFIIHDAGKLKQPGGQLTDADLLAIRLPYTTEIIKGDHAEITTKTDIKLDIQPGVIDFVIAEVSSETCKFNWITDPESERKPVNVEFLRYVIRRFGWWDDEDEINRISKLLSDEKCYKEERKDAEKSIHTRVRLLSFGVIKNPKLPLQQITITDMLHFMKYDLFACYGHTDEFKQIVSDHKQWDTLIHEVYKRLLGHKHQEQTPEEVVEWLFPMKSLFH